MGHARAVATAEDPEGLIAEIIAKGLSVRDAERLAQRVRPGLAGAISRASARNANAGGNADLAALERQLGDVLGLRVKVQHKGDGGGSVQLNYSTLEQLDMICQRLSGEPI
jgi:ParB family chromosome partitioning protein